MGISSSNNGCTGTQDYTTLVDKLVGSPYEFVKFVAQNISQVSTVARALQGGPPEELMLTNHVAKLSGSIGDVGSTTQFDLPEGILPNKILGISAFVTDSSGSLFYNDSRYFYTQLTNNKLQLQLRGDAPNTFVNAAVRWVIVYEAF